MTSEKETAFDIAIATTFSLLLLAITVLVGSLYLTGESNRDKFKYAFTKSMECRVKLTTAINPNTPPEGVAIVSTAANSLCGKVPNYKDFD